MSCRKLRRDRAAVFCEILKIAVRRMMVDGGLLIVASYSGNKRFPLQLQIKEVDELDSSVLFHGKNQVVGGIEVNSFNKPVAYHFTVYDTFGETGRTVRIPADRVIYLNKIKRTSQVREISGFSNVLSRLRDLNQFLNAVSVKERMLACLAVFIKKVNAALGLGRNQKTDKTTGAKKQKLAPGMDYGAGRGGRNSGGKPIRSGIQCKGYGFNPASRCFIGIGTEL